MPRVVLTTTSHNDIPGDHHALPPARDGAVKEEKDFIQANKF